MITLNITIGGNLEITLDKGAKEDLKEILERATNTDGIIAELLDVSGYLGNDWHEPTYIGLTEAPAIAYGAIYDEEEDRVNDGTEYEKIWYYPDYIIMTPKEIGTEAKQIAEKTQWDGLEICDIFLEALTEANFHSLRKKLEVIINEEFEL